MGLVIHVMINKDHLLNYVIDIYFMRYEWMNEVYVILFY